MSLLPSGVCLSPGNNYFAKNPDQNTLVGLAGFKTGNLWSTSALSGVIYTAIPVPGMTPANVAQVTVSLTNVGSQNLTDAQDCWLVATACGTNQILVYIAGGGGGTNGQPVNNSQYGLSWTVVA